jgi:hypothetical protein
MDAPQFDPSWLEQAKIAAAPLCGGMIRLFLRPAETIPRGIFMLACCWTCGFFGTPPVMHWLELDPVYAGGMGAMLGLVGLSLAEGLLKAVDGVDLKAWIARWATKGTGE